MAVVNFILFFVYMLWLNIVKVATFSIISLMWGSTKNAKRGKELSIMLVNPAICCEVCPNKLSLVLSH